MFISQDIFLRGTDRQYRFRIFIGKSWRFPSICFLQNVILLGRIGHFLLNGCGNEKWVMSHAESQNTSQMGSKPELDTGPYLYFGSHLYIDWLKECCLNWSEPFLSQLDTIYQLWVVGKLSLGAASWVRRGQSWGTGKTALAQGCAPHQESLQAVPQPESWPVGSLALEFKNVLELFLTRKPLETLISGLREFSCRK